MKSFLWGVMVLCLSLSLGKTAERQKVILDCDLGGDVDDAFAVALLLASPELEILGLVMDHGNTTARARVACRLLYEAGLSNIPVVVGRPTPVIVGQDTALAGDSPQFAWAKEFSLLQPTRQTAADFIIEKLHQFPHQIILLTVGPLPNIADVLKKEPEVLKLAKRVVSMFGSFYKGYGPQSPPEAEWNVKADVQAARMLLKANVFPLFVGLDVTTMVKLKKEDRLRLLYRNSPLTDALCALYSLWLFEPWAKADPTLFDPVAVGFVLWPELFKTKKVHITIDDTGKTIIDDQKAPNCEIAVHIQKDEFIRRLMQRLLKQNLMRWN